MFKYSENNIFNRYGVDRGKIYSATYKLKSRNLVLQTEFGFIPLDNISSFIDLFNSNNYLHDKTETLLPYKKNEDEEVDKKVAKLTIILKKHWVGSSYKDVLEKIIGEYLGVPYYDYLKFHSSVQERIISGLDDIKQKNELNRYIKAVEKEQTKLQKVLKK